MYKIFFLAMWLLSTVELTVAAHDTTGGMKTKISEAAMIAKLGIDVYIVKVIFVCYVSYVFLIS
jgi:isopentenyl phosphate kinase